MGVAAVTNKLHIKSFRLANYGAKLIKVAGPILWNSLPSRIRDSVSINTFKYYLKKYLIELYV